MSALHGFPKDMDISASTIEAALRQLPTPVGSWHVETGSDSTEDPVVWVWAMLQDDEGEFAKRSRVRLGDENLSANREASPG